ncbi:MAG TPA: DUF3300 domain-containing protein [Burkholderiales bacterium]|nr:DUF3300 domain-containing protein [Burkholderiales bacterium]
MLRQLFALLLAASFSFAPQIAPAQDRPAFTQQELDQMLAPIALYPDALLSQIMMASTYPLEVVEAARWSAANPNLNGEQAVGAVERNDWDPSVKSMVAFPQILAMMGARLDWTQRLGDAFLGQEPQVMDAVQGLRQKAYAAGNLRSNDQYRVDSQGQYISVEEANPAMAYVPYYDPSLVYGQWWWPEYPPVYWAPWPGYRARPGFGAGLLWGLGIRLGADFFFGAFDWHQRRVNVVNVNNFYRPRDANLTNRGSNAWQHDPNHRRSVPYREASVRASFGRASAAPASAAPEARRDFRGHLPAAAGQRASAAPAPVARANTDSASTRANVPASRGSNIRGAPSRPIVPVPASVPAVASRPATEQRPHVLEGVGRGVDERNSSARGRTSIQATAPAISAPVSRRPPERVAAPRPAERAAPRPAEKARDSK